jgi:hypothetical protein
MTSQLTAGQGNDRNLVSVDKLRRRCSGLERIFTIAPKHRPCISGDDSEDNDRGTARSHAMFQCRRKSAVTGLSRGRQDLM